MRPSAQTSPSLRFLALARVAGAPPIIRDMSTSVSTPAVTERLPALDGVAPADAADAFRELPGLALLESARPGRAGRWSFLVAEPVAVLDGSAPGDDPFAEARAALDRLDRSPLTPGAPPFAGGLVGHLGYELGRRLERLPAGAIDDQGLPDLRLGLHAWASRLGRARRAGVAGRPGDRRRRRGLSSARWPGCERVRRARCACRSAASRHSRA